MSKQGVELNFVERAYAEQASLQAFEQALNNQMNPHASMPYYQKEDQSFEAGWIETDGTCSSNPNWTLFMLSVFRREWNYVHLFLKRGLDNTIDDVILDIDQVFEPNFGTFPGCNPLLEALPTIDECAPDYIKEIAHVVRLKHLRELLQARFNMLMDDQKKDGNEPSADLAMEQDCFQNTLKELREYAVECGVVSVPVVNKTTIIETYKRSPQYSM